MMQIDRQVETGRLVCPLTRARLRVSGERLVTEDGAHAYPLLPNRVPILIDDPARMERYLAANPQMLTHYAQTATRDRSRLRRWKDQIDRSLARKYRTRESMEAREAFLNRIGPDSLALSVGGGPYRSDPSFVNVNAGPFPNVDVVGDALNLPYADNSVDAIHCDSVLEHLRLPEKATQEMYRVLRPGGQVLSITPFLMQFHGYPDHYQNYTVPGHRFLFERNGFTVVRAGVCIGPIVSLVDQASVVVMRLTPTFLHRVVAPLVKWLGEGVKLLDRFVRDKPWAHELACTTYVLATKAP
jgi:hypothetical protein